MNSPNTCPNELIIHCPLYHRHIHNSSKFEGPVPCFHQVIVHHRPSICSTTAAPILLLLLLPTRRCLTPLLLPLQPARKPATTRQDTRLGLHGRRNFPLLATAMPVCGWTQTMTKTRPLRLVAVSLLHTLRKSRRIVWWKIRSSPSWRIYGKISCISRGTASSTRSRGST